MPNASTHPANVKKQQALEAEQSAEEYVLRQNMKDQQDAQMMQQYLAGIVKPNLAAKSYNEMAAMTPDARYMYMQARNGGLANPNRNILAEGGQMGMIRDAQADQLMADQAQADLAARGGLGMDDVADMQMVNAADNAQYQAANSNAALQQAGLPGADNAAMQPTPADLQAYVNRQR